MNKILIIVFSLFLSSCAYAADTAVLQDSSGNVQGTSGNPLHVSLVGGGSPINFAPNVGIGSASPGQALDVQGSIRTIGFIMSGNTPIGGYVLTAIDSTGAATWNPAGGATFANPSATVGTSAVNGVASTAMRSDAAPAINLTMSPTMTGNWTFSPGSGNTVITSGNVGIDNASPGQTLDVTGTVKAIGYMSGSYVVDSNGNVGIGTSTTGGHLVTLGVGASSAFIDGTGITKFANTTVSYTAANIEGSSATVVTVGNLSNAAGAVVNIIGGTQAGGGNVGIGSVHPGQQLDVNGSLRTTQLYVSGIGSDAGKTDATICEDTTNHQFYSGSGTIGICLGTSSARFKHDIIPMKEGLAQILKLRPVNFFYKNGYGDNGGKQQYGLIAEEVKDVMPGIVAFDKDGIPNSVDLLATVPILIKSVQEQQHTILWIWIIIFLISSFLLITYNWKRN